MAPFRPTLTALESRDCPSAWAYRPDGTAFRVLYVDHVHPAAVYAVPPSDPLVGRESAFPGDTRAVIAEVEKLPAAVRALVAARGGKVEVFSGSVNDLPELADFSGTFHGGTVAVTRMDTHTVYIKADASWALPHEFGHLVSSFLSVGVFNDYVLRVAPQINFDRFPVMGPFGTAYFHEPVESMAQTWWAFEAAPEKLEPLLYTYWSDAYASLGLSP